MWMVSDNREKKFLGRVFLGALVVVGTQLASNSRHLQSLCFTANIAQAADPARGSEELVVFAAASLTEPFREIGRLLELTHPGVKIIFNFGGTSTLRLQLEQGARADVFASADTIQMEQAKKSKVIQGEARVFAANRLVLIVPAANSAQIKTFCDLGKDGVKLNLAHADVPVGNYSRQAITKAKAACGTDFEQRVLKNIVSEEENVKQVVTKIQLGEADAGIVYISDVTAKVNEAIHTITIDEEYNQIASYPIALTAAAKNRTMGEAFIVFVLSPEGQVILGGYGFMPVREKQPSEESE